MAVWYINGPAPFGPTALTHSKMVGIAGLATVFITYLVYITTIVSTFLSIAISKLAGTSWWPYQPHLDVLQSSPVPRVAVIGAGLTGVSSAAACLRAGVEVVIFEKSDRIGGIWSR
jgi:NADPH-dependent 2,4-dienoyl-CoA reductase/sulfur reductase-like enzyme